MRGWVKRWKATTTSSNDSVGEYPRASRMAYAVCEVLAEFRRSGVFHGSNGSGGSAAWCRLICRLVAAIITGIMLWYGGGCSVEAGEARGYHRVFPFVAEENAALPRKHAGEIQRNAHADLRAGVPVGHKHLQTASVGVLSFVEAVRLHVEARLIFLVSGIPDAESVALPRIPNVSRTTQSGRVALVLRDGWNVRREGGYAHRKDAVEGYSLCDEVRREGITEKSA